MGKGHRQALKLIKARDNLIKSFGSYSEFEKWIFHTLEEREKIPCRTILIVNAGSSGSHWLHNMLKELLSLPGAGEVYLPESLQNQLPENYSPLDLVQLVQSQASDGEMAALPVINTSHSIRLMKRIVKSEKCRELFLSRNPVDIVLSRTFRKEEYKKINLPRQHIRRILI